MARMKLTSTSLRNLSDQVRDAWHDGWSRDGSIRSEMIELDGNPPEEWFVQWVYKPPGPRNTE